MPKDLHIREIDDKIHSQLGSAADELGVSVNSIVKDAIDKWFGQRKQIPKNHNLVLYGDDYSMISLLKSMDRLTKDANLFKVFCGPIDYSSVRLLKKLDWFDGTVYPYNSKLANFGRYTAQIVDKISIGSKKKPVCWFDFIIEDISKSSLKEAIRLEEVYNKNRLDGITFCTYRTSTLLEAKIRDLIELFSHHDQVFVLMKDEVYKLHITKENVHKLLLN
jgi:hypothetical protein